MDKTSYFKSLLQEELSITYPSLHVDGWFSSLSFRYDEKQNTLTIIFPHRFFKTWFEGTNKNVFEHAAKTVFQKNHTSYPHIVYEEPKQKIFPSSFFNKGPKEKDFFEEFIYNSKNKFPLTVAKEVARNPFAGKYTPIFFYGKSSTGKTHILQCIKESICQNYLQEQRLFFGRTEDYCQELTLHGAKGFFEKKDIFLWDHLQSSQELLYLQEEFIFFVELCTSHKKLLIFTSTTGPNEQKTWSEALRARLNAGLLVQIKNSDIDVRMRYVVKYCRVHGIKLHKEDMLFLAQRCANISILNGILLKIQAYAIHSSKGLQSSDIKNILTSTGEEERNLSAQDILSFIAQYFEMNEEYILNDVRQPDIVHARQVAMYLCRDLLGLSYPAIGKFFGGKDHSTVIYAIKKIKKLTDTNKNMQQMVTDLRKKCMAL